MQAHYKWISVENTHILMMLQNPGEMREWHPVAQVTLRQIYPGIEARWYAWGHGPESQEARICKAETLREAITEVEREMKVVWPNLS